jgi:hypothetical protein
VAAVKRDSPVVSLGLEEVILL